MKKYKRYISRKRRLVLNYSTIWRVFELGALLLFVALAGAQTWTPLTHQQSNANGTALLLTDGTVMVHNDLTGQWSQLTPDITGSYINGTWSSLTSMPSGYGPLYYASAVLPDGRVVVEGGEYNLNGQSPAETNLGAIYDPVANSWTSIPAPPGWNHIGDAQGTVLANGTFMLGNCGDACVNPRQQALLNASTLTWTFTGSGKADQTSEEGWTLLPSGRVLTVDVWNGTESELYDPSTGGWSLAGFTSTQLPNTRCSEIGPAVLQPNGNVFAVGGTSNTSIYNTFSGAWSAGPTFPNGLGSNDGPAAVLPDGNVLVQASGNQSNCYAAGSTFFEFDGTTLISVPGPSNAPNDASYFGRMLVLPTGQILFIDGTQTDVYTASGTYQSAWQPTIASFPNILIPGTKNYTITGTQFNGLSQGAMYGDDAQMATNYPLVRITMNATGHVFYARTHDHSTMAVATGTATVSTQFDVPSNIEMGDGTLVVVANGIPSNPVAIGVPVTLTVNISGSGTVSSTPTGINCGAPGCTANFNVGQQVTLTAAPLPGSQNYFVGWSGAGCSGTGTCSVTMNSSQSVTAIFAPNTLTASISGSGTVVSTNIQGISCGAPGCSANYNVGQKVTLAATPANYYHLSSWSGCDSVNGNQCNVTVNNARTVTATFVLNTLTVVINGSGIVTSNPAAIQCGPPGCSANFMDSQSVTLTPYGGLGYALGSWTTTWPGANCSGVTCSGVLNGPQLVTANFTGANITVTAPTSGQPPFNAGNPLTINWMPSSNIAGDTLRIDLLRGGVLFNNPNSPLVASVLASAGTATWNIPFNQALAADYQIQISDLNNPVVGTSASFEIKGTTSAIALTSVNNGIVLRAHDTNIPITWIYTGAAGPNVTIQLYKENALVSTISGPGCTSIGTGGNGSCTWTRTTDQQIGSGYSIKITDPTSGATDQSHGFVIIR